MVKINVSVQHSATSDSSGDRRLSVRRSVAAPPERAPSAAVCDESDAMQGE